MQTIQTIIVEALVELLDMPDASQISPETRLQEDLGIDSGLLLELFMLVEERLPDAAVDPAVLRPEEFASVASFAALIARSLSETAAS
ncbi:MAG: acyl carrier protein [Paenirhodobacter sp.]|uniref:acyl carrier protein n=1 Tax=Paenirhodobacter sp. TaxID=1965326 RepID=UPI003D0FD0C3